MRYHAVKHLTQGLLMPELWDDCEFRLKMWEVAGVTRFLMC